MIRGWLKPTAAGWVLFALLIMAQGILIDCSATIHYAGDVVEWTTTIGLPPIVQILEYRGYAPPGHQVTVFWHRLGVVLAAIYLLSMTLGQLVSRGVDGTSARPLWRHPAAQLFFVILVIILSAIALTLAAPMKGLRPPSMAAAGPELDPRLLSFLSYTLFGLFFVMPVTILVMILRRRRERKRASLRGFPVDVEM